MTFQTFKKFMYLLYWIKRVRTFAVSYTVGCRFENIIGKSRFLHENQLPLEEYYWISTPWEQESTSGNISLYYSAVIHLSWYERKLKHISNVQKEKLDTALHHFCLFFNFLQLEYTWPYKTNFFVFLKNWSIMRIRWDAKFSIALRVNG